MEFIEFLFYLRKAAYLLSTLLPLIRLIKSWWQKQYSCLPKCWYIYISRRYLWCEISWEWFKPDKEEFNSIKRRCLPYVMTKISDVQCKWRSLGQSESKYYSQQECIPVGCVPPAHNSMALGGLPDRDPNSGQRPPLWTETSWTKTPLDRDPPDSDLPGQRPPCEQNHRQV